VQKIQDFCLDHYWIRSTENLDDTYSTYSPECFGVPALKHVTGIPNGLSASQQADAEAMQCDNSCPSFEPLHTQYFINDNSYDTLPSFLNIGKTRRSLTVNPLLVLPLTVVLF
jgi:hypothetical protein